ncbi:MAG TPA: transposase [Pyrinomonadaceae bacterium]
MNPPKCSDDDYINFVIATPRSVSATEAAKVQGDEEQAPAHDAFTRLLHRLEPDAATLWGEARTQVTLTQGILVIDDSTLDKPYARKMELVTRHWSGKHHAVVSGINLITLLWTDGDRHVPVDYRIFDKKQDALTKNDHFQAMLREAHQRGFAPSCVAFDSWYSGLENLKLIRSFGWIWLTRLKSNRKVNPDREGLRPVNEVEIGAAGRVVWLEGFGLIRVFKIVATDGDVELWATNRVEMSDLERVRWAGYSWAIESYHRGIKQFCLIERAQVRSRRAWRNHINLCLRAFLRLESHCYYKGISWYEAKTSIIREAVRAYIANPLYSLVSTA